MLRIMSGVSPWGHIIFWLKPFPLLILQLPSHWRSHHKSRVQMPPARKGQKKAVGQRVQSPESRVQSPGPAGMPIYDPPQLRVAKSSGVFVESVPDEDLIRQARTDLKRVPWGDLALTGSATEKAFLAYHLVCLMPITMQTLEQGAYHKEYMQQVASYMSSCDFQRSEESPDITSLQKKMKQLSSEVTKLRNDLSVSHELVQNMPPHLRVRAAQAVASRRSCRSSSPAISVRSGISSTSVRSKAASLSDDELKATVQAIVTESKNRGH
jgi:hypothetical protein